MRIPGETYARALSIELQYRGHEVQAEIPIDVYYREILASRHRIDCIIDGKVIVDVKAVETLPKVAFRQCTSYLKASGLRVGLVLDFGEKPQLKRVVYDGAPLGPDTRVAFPRESRFTRKSPIRSDQIRSDFSV